MANKIKITEQQLKRIMAEQYTQKVSGKRKSEVKEEDVETDIDENEDCDTDGKKVETKESAGSLRKTSKVPTKEISEDGVVGKPKTGEMKESGVVGKPKTGEMKEAEGALRKVSKVPTKEISEEEAALRQTKKVPVKKIAEQYSQKVSGKRKSEMKEQDEFGGESPDLGDMSNKKPEGESSEGGIGDTSSLGILSSVIKTISDRLGEAVSSQDWESVSALVSEIKQSLGETEEEGDPQGEPAPEATPPQEEAPQDDQLAESIKQIKANFKRYL